MACPFCTLIAAPERTHVVLDDPAALAFLDRRPVFLGHVLVVPRDHVETLGDLPAERVGTFFRCVQRVTRGVEDGMAAAGTFVAINDKVSQSVPHLHVHVVPRRPKDGLRGFFWPRMKYASDEEAAATAARIRAAVRPE
ncbi:MAG: HIT family protein [Polyangiaceae bacterium]